MSGEKYYQILYCAISVAQMVMKLLFGVLEDSYWCIMLTFLLFELQKWHSTKFDSTLHQKLISTIRELLKASFNPLPQGFGAISGGSRGTNHQYLYFLREWEGVQLDLRQFLSLSARLQSSEWLSDWPIYIWDPSDLTFLQINTRFRINSVKP